MALQHLATLVCDYPLQDEEGRFSLIGTFQNVQTSRFPSAKDPIGIFVQFTGAPGTPYQIVLRDPKGDEVAIAEGTVNPPDEIEAPRQWAVSFLAKMAVFFTAPGVYSIILRSEGQEIHTYPLGVLPPREGDPGKEEGA